MISNVCNADCNYCFAGSYLSSAATAFMPLLEFKAALDFLERSGIQDVRLLGGEPTLHPDFPTLLQMALVSGKHITLFTHGVLSESALRALAVLSPQQLLVIINESAQFASQNSQRELRRREVLKTLGPRVMLGVNLQSPLFNLELLFETIHEYQLRPALRLGLALPGPGALNKHVYTRFYRAIGSRLCRQSAAAAAHAITLEMDCGFVRCMFDDAELAEMQKNGVRVGWFCSPIVDICPGGEVLHCFSLSERFKLTLQAGDTAALLHAAFETQTRAYRTAGIFRECSTCLYKSRGECSGGCLGLTKRRFAPAAINLPIPESSTASKEASFGR